MPSAGIPASTLGVDHKGMPIHATSGETQIAPPVGPPTSASRDALAEAFAPPWRVGIGPAGAAVSRPGVPPPAGVESVDARA
jgi:hypothetical protein